MAFRLETNGRLNGGSPVPKYHQLKQILKEKIETGEWAPGDLIPSEPELCRMYGVSRTTVRQTMASLVSEGLVVRQQGKGTFVAGPKIEQELVGFYSFTEDVMRKGLQPRSEILSKGVTAASKAVASKLGLAPGERVVYLTRLRLADEEPIMLETSYLPEKYCQGLDRIDFRGRPLYDVLGQDFGVELTRARETFEAGVADEYEASWLRIWPGAPVMLLERLAYMKGKDGQDTPIEFCRSVVRGDRCRFQVDLPKRDASSR